MLLHPSLYVVRYDRDRCDVRMFAIMINRAHNNVKGEDAPNKCEGMTRSELIALFESLKCPKCGRADWGYYMGNVVCCSVGCC